tara:strand:- start:47 stop:310 length:264 start_codon:yes stop_codon:yes gene_type:complete
MACTQACTCHCLTSFTQVIWYVDAIQIALEHATIPLMKTLSKVSRHKKWLRKFEQFFKWKLWTQSPAMNGWSDRILIVKKSARRSRA